MDNKVDIEYFVAVPFEEFTSKYYSTYISFGFSEKEYIGLCLTRLHFNYVKHISNGRLNQDIDYLNLKTITEAQNAIGEEMNSFKYEDSEKTEEYYQRLDDLWCNFEFLDGLREIVKKILFLRSNLLKIGYRRYSFTEEGIIFEKEPELETELDTANEKSIAYKIALLHEAGFFDLPKVKKLLVKDRNKIIQMLIGGSISTINNNILSLNPNSSVSIKYTAYQKLDEVKKLL